METETRVIRISVRNLVEFVMRSGDLDNRRLTGAEKEKYDKQFIPNLTTVEEAAELNTDKDSQEIRQKSP